MFVPGNSNRLFLILFSKRKVTNLIKIRNILLLVVLIKYKIGL